MAAWSAKNCSRPAWWAAVSFSRNRRRKRRESTPTERRKLGRQAVQCSPSGEMPPPGTMIWACGWWHPRPQYPSADHVQVFYPFHPLHGTTLQILRRPKREDGAVCVMDPAGRRLKIPVWMLLAEWAEVKIWQQPHLGKHALLSLASLITSQLDFKDRVHDNLLQTPVSGCEGG